MKQMDFKYKCKSCVRKGKFQDGSDGCSKFNIKINLEKDGCSWHKRDETTCCLCGNSDDNMIILYGVNNDVYPFCNNCFKSYHTCQLCQDKNICEFKNDHSEPQIIMQTIRQGYMTMQQQVKNPKLIAKHCTTCHCSWGKENCHKDDNGINCPNWQLKTDLLQ